MYSAGEQETTHDVQLRYRTPKALNLERRGSNLERKKTFVFSPTQARFSCSVLQQDV